MKEQLKSYESDIAKANSLITQVANEVRELKVRTDYTERSSDYTVRSARPEFSMLQEITEHPEFKQWWGRKGKEITAAAEKRKLPSFDELYATSPEFREWHKNREKE